MTIFLDSASIHIAAKSFVGTLCWTDSCNGVAHAASGDSQDCRGEACDTSLADLGYGWDDLSPVQQSEVERELADFLGQPEVAADILACGISADQTGHDFALTRNGHGTGFWDRGHGEAGVRLSAACKPYGEANAYVCDNGDLGIDL